MAASRIVSVLRQLARYGEVHDVLDTLLNPRSRFRYLLPDRYERLFEVRGVEVGHVQITDDWIHVVPHRREPLLAVLIVGPSRVALLVILFGAILERRRLDPLCLSGEPFCLEVGSFLRGGRCHRESGGVAPPLCGARR